VSKTTNILLADLKIKIEHRFDFMSGFCKKYIADFDTPDICVFAEEEAVLKENEMVPAAPVEICESLCIYREIAERLPVFERFVFHGAAIELDGKAVVFTAPSGTGKTTHISLWKKNLGDRVKVINGDKPIFKISDKITVYGTPWAGKEGLHHNTSAPIKAVCVLKQGKINKITRLEPSATISRLMRQVYLPKDSDSCEKTLGLLGSLVEKIPVFELECDISDEAFNTAYNAFM